MHTKHKRKKNAFEANIYVSDRITINLTLVALLTTQTLPILILALLVFK